MIIHHYYSIILSSKYNIRSPLPAPTVSGLMLLAAVTITFSCDHYEHGQNYNFSSCNLYHLWLPGAWLFIIGPE